MLCSVVTSCGAVAFQMLFTTFHSPRFYPQSADWCQSILNAIHNFPLTKFLSSNSLQTGAKAFQMLFTTFHSPSFYLQTDCRLVPKHFKCYSSLSTHQVFIFKWFADCYVAICALCSVSLFCLHVMC